MKPSAAVEAMEYVDRMAPDAIRLRLRSDRDRLTGEARREVARHIESLDRDGTMRIAIYEVYNKTFNQMDFQWKALDFSKGETTVSLKEAKRILSNREWALLIEEVDTGNATAQPSPSAPMTPDQASLLQSLAAQVADLSRQLAEKKAAPEPPAEPDQPKPKPPRKRKTKAAD
jgi:hypothetical protein